MAAEHAKECRVCTTSVRCVSGSLFPYTGAQPGRTTQQRFGVCWGNALPPSPSLLYNKVLNYTPSPFVQQWRAKSLYQGRWLLRKGMMAFVACVASWIPVKCTVSWLKAGWS